MHAITFCFIKPYFRRAKAGHKPSQGRPNWRETRLVAHPCRSPLSTCNGMEQYAHVKRVPDGLFVSPPPHSPHFPTILTQKTAGAYK